jgi:hypothetical protein
MDGFIMGRTPGAGLTQIRIWEELGEMTGYKTVNMIKK